VWIDVAEIIARGPEIPLWTDSFPPRAPAMTLDFL
jgi:hypothetical protein